MKDKKRSFTLIEVIIAAVLLTIGVAGGIAGYKIANRQIEQSNIKNMAMTENGKIQETIASWDIDNDSLKETAIPYSIDISNAEFKQKYSPTAFYTVRDVTDADGNLLYKEITVTVKTNLSGKEVKVQTQSVKTNFAESEFIPLVHNECVSGKCTEVAGAGSDACSTDAECRGGGETHNECTADGRCVEVAGAGSDACSTDAECTGGGETHNECTADGRCIEVKGAGADECNSNADCTVGDTHNECTADGRCVEVAGAGSDACSTDAECRGGRKTHNECTADGRCIEVAGAGTDACKTDADCECVGELCSGCNCTPWEVKGCGLGNCKPTERYDVRVCNSIEEEHCDVEERCVYGTEECMGCNACSDWVKGECGANGCGPLYRYITRDCPDDKPYCSEESCLYDPDGCQSCDSCTPWEDSECSWQVGYRVQVRECFPEGCGLEKQSVPDDTCGCQCGSWEDKGCGKGGCPSNLMFQRRQCVPSGCDETKRCCEHRECGS